MEFAQIFARFGVEVTVLGRNPRLLPPEEPELVDILRDLLAEEGMRIETGVTLECVSLTAAASGSPVSVTETRSSSKWTRFSLPPAAFRTWRTSVWRRPA